jgi:hypothetical protein
MDFCIEDKYQTLYYDADGLGAGVRGDARVINENQREKGWDEVNVEPFRGSGSVNDPDGEIVEKRTNKDFLQISKPSLGGFYAYAFKTRIGH